MKFRYLFDPIKIGPIELRNRIVFTAHGTVFSEKGLPSERSAYYLEERAKGGVGLIITEFAAVHPSTRMSSRFVAGYDERCIPGYQRIADAVHQHGAKVFSQIWHGGRQGVPGIPWAPSSIPCPETRSIPHVMEIDEIKEVIEGYAQTARNVIAAGVDGVEIHGGHGYLPQQFLSPITNRRTDEYGGSKENRLRFILEVISKVREAVAPDKAVGIRISSDEFLEGGLTLDDMREIAPILVGTGKLDYLSVSVGTYKTLHFQVAPMAVPPGYQIPLTEQIRQVVNIPIIGVGRINDPVQAEKILEEGGLDLVAMTRACICDPELPNKALAGKIEDIRNCVSCNQGCLRRNFQGLPISCLQNPAVGKEKLLGIGTLRPAEVKKNVLVIGGGPAGLKAALTAAQRGHKVTLVERNFELGGQVLLAAKIPYKQDFESVVRHLILQVKKEGVKLVLGTEASAALVADYAPDAVIVATGAHATFPPIPGDGRIVTAEDVLSGVVNLSGNQAVLVIDEDGHDVGSGVAELLADAGIKVYLITTFPYVAEGLTYNKELPLLYERLLAKQIELIPFTAIKSVSAGSAVVNNIYSGQERVLSVNVTVYAGLKAVNDSIYRSLRGKFKELFIIGDCLAPRKAIDAIREGDQVGREI